MNIRIQNRTQTPLDNRLWYHDLEGQEFPFVYDHARGFLVQADGTIQLVLEEHAEEVYNDSTL